MKSLGNILIIITLLHLNIAGFSQNKPRNLVWPTYIRHGLDFNTNPPEHFYSGISLSQALNIHETMASINNATTGELQFYSSGTYAFNKLHQIMPNGSGLRGNNSTTQGAIIIPFPNDTNLYYLFTMDEYGNTPGLSYSVVDMRLDNGLGNIQPNKKNIILNGNSLSEKMVAITHINCSDYWLVVHLANSDCFLSYQITPAAILPPVKSCIGKYYDLNNARYAYSGAGEMELSPNGKMLAVAHYDYGHNVYSELFDFDNSTGIISNQRIIWTGFSYGIEFSPDNTKLYTTSSPMHNGELPPHALQCWYLNQFDISNEATINDSRIVIDSAFEAFNGIELAPNGKIYGVRGPYVINNPNNSGLASNYERIDYIMPYVSFTSDTFYGAHNFPNHYVDIRTANATVINDTVLDNSGSLTLMLDSPFYNVQWNGTSHTGSFIINDTGYYYVTAENACGIIRDTFYVGKNIEIIPSDTLLTGIKFPNAFTPNKDGHNDYFFPVMVNDSRVVELRVYNRRGEQMCDNAETGWDGTFKQEKQPVGTYLFYAIVQRGKAVKSYTGSFTLLH